MIHSRYIPVKPESQTVNPIVIVADTENQIQLYKSDEEANYDNIFNVTLKSSGGINCFECEL